MLKALFYARFDPEKGPSIIHQYPRHSIIASQDGDNQTLLDFKDISAYTIPDYEICNRPMSIVTNGCRVLGFPVSLEDPKYERNRFTFNVCFVLDEEEDTRPWNQIVKKTAAFFRSVEEEDEILGREEELEGLIWAGERGYPAYHVGVIYALLQEIFDQLNTYEEACVRLDDLRVLNLFLSRPRPIPPEVHAWDVPMLVKQPPSPEQWTWDLSLAKIHPHIDGIKHVRRIAELADVELRLTKRAVRELLYHGRAILLDLFHFQAIYTTTGDFTFFARSPELQAECLSYITTDPTKNPFASTEPTHPTPTPASLISLYASLAPGVTVQDFLLSNQTALSAIDIRRFITFGLIKGILRRIHKYALLTPSSSTTTSSALDAASTSAGTASPTKSRLKSDDAVARDIDRAWRKAALSSGWATPPHTDMAAQSSPSLRTMVGSLSRSARSGGGASSSAMSEGAADDMVSRHFLDGRHCLDQMCAEMHISERKVLDRMKGGRMGEVVLFNR